MDILLTDTEPREIKLHGTKHLHKATGEVRKPKYDLWTSRASCDAALNFTECNRREKLGEGYKALSCIISYN